MTPFHEGKAVFEHLANGYHLYVKGGQHAIYGWGYDCPDKYITDFLVGGDLPDQHEIVCEDWGEDVIIPYEPRIQRQVSDYAGPLDIFVAIDREIRLQPEYFYSSFAEETAVACPLGGIFTFGGSDAGETLAVDGCAYMQDFVVSGSGSYDYAHGLFTIDVEVSGDKTGTLTYTRSDDDGSVSVTGEYGGEQIDVRQ